MQNLFAPGGPWATSWMPARAACRIRNGVASLDPALLELVPTLARSVPPATVIDKTRYSAFVGTQLHPVLQERSARDLIITGSETDVCVLASVLDAVDLGYRVIVVHDGVCSSSDEGHDALMKLYHRRYSLQIETADAETVLRRWS